MKWCIVTDSSCDIENLETNSEITFAKVPFSISIDEEEIVDDENLNVENMINKMETYKKASLTSCPSPQAWFNHFEKADFSIAITISSGVSGSFNSASTAKNMIEEKYSNKKVFVLDSKTAGSVLSMCAEKAVELIKSGLNFEEVTQQLEKYNKKRHTIFALSSFGNLVKNGRVGKIAGFLAKILKMWGVGINTTEGKIAIKKKTRGENNVLKTFIDDMNENNFDSDYVVITHCQNLELATKFKNMLTKIWNKIKVKILQARGLCSYYAERKGLIVGY